MSSNPVLARPNVYKFDQYREFIKEFLDYLKTTQKRFSLRQFTKASGFGSPSFFSSIISKKRNLGPDAIERVCTAFKMTKAEESFFEILVDFDQSKTEEERRTHYDKMMKNRSYLRYHSLRKAEYDYFTRWFFPVLREMVALKSFREDFPWLAEHFEPPLDPLDVQRGVDSLLRINLLSRDESNRLKQKNAQIRTEPVISGIHAVKYHEKVLQKAGDAIKHLDPSRREYRALTFTCKETDFDLIKNKIDSFWDSLIDEFAETRPDHDSVFQVNVQALPMVKALKGSDD